MPKNPATSHGTSRQSLGEPEQRNTKKRMVTGGFQVGRIGFRPDGKKRRKVELPNGDAEKGIPQHIPKRWPTRDFQKNQS